MSANLVPTPFLRFTDTSTGLALVGGLVYTYAAGTSTPQATYTDSTGGTPNANPIVLNSRGECNCWLDPTLAYKIVVKDSLGNSIATYDQVKASAAQYDFEASTGALSVGWIQQGSSAVPRKVGEKLYESVSVGDFGAVSGDTGDQTAVIQFALNTAKAVYVPDGTYRFASTLSVPSNTRIYGPGKLHYTGVGIALQIAGDNVTLDGFTLYADNTGLYSANNMGVYLDLTASGPITYANRTVIKNLRIYGFGNSGIYTNRTYDMLVANNFVSDCGMHGITSLSPIRAKVDGNQVSRIQPGAPGGIGYGIQLTRDNTYSLANAPMPTNCSVTNNVVTVIPVYAGLDCHSGQNLTFTGNTTDECTVSLDISHATGGGDQATVTNLTIAGNTFRASSTQPSAPAILIDAQSGAGEIARGITITGNTITKHGVDPASPFEPTIGGAIFATSVDGVVINGNTFIDCVGRCVSAHQSARGVIVNGNNVVNLVLDATIQEAFAVTHTTAQMTADLNVMLSSGGYMYNSVSVDNSKGMKVGGGNIVQGGAVLLTASAQANLRGGGLYMGAQVVIGWNAAGTVQWVAFENINYYSSSVTVTKNGTGDFTVTWPAGIFSAQTAPLPSCKDPAAGVVRTEIVTTDSLTSARILTFDSTGTAIDCTENVLMVWGR